MFQSCFRTLAVILVSVVIVVLLGGGGGGGCCLSFFLSFFFWGGGGAGGSISASVHTNSPLVHVPCYNTWVLPCLALVGWKISVLYVYEEVPQVEFMYPAFTRMPGVSYRRRPGSLLLYLYVFRALINSLLGWFLVDWVQLFCAELFISRLFFVEASPMKLADFPTPLFRIIPYFFSSVRKAVTRINMSALSWSL